MDAAIKVVESAAASTGRDPSGIGMEGRVRLTEEVSRAVDDIDRWTDADATHISLDTLTQSCEPVAEHLRRLAEIASDLRLT
ncbi:hypothetical protein [Lentzea cavernae]|uniref:Uncharacterized protein n=1 Tax=Lentzea cavernae TaxID=2020703 RepID=A0ABQ3M305_9PSEU|nr:hypothetical protein [Lentzea cavernae]GHH32299.1 hypothetical protein GCM10017774_13000 [Lentzea cavernae]